MKWSGMKSVMTVLIASLALPFSYLFVALSSLQLTASQSSFWHPPLPSVSLLLKRTDPIQVLFSKRTPNIPAFCHFQNFFHLHGNMILYHILP